jgi:hypothetical protein
MQGRAANRICLLCENLFEGGCVTCNYRKQNRGYETYIALYTMERSLSIPHLQRQVSRILGMKK